LARASRSALVTLVAHPPRSMRRACALLLVTDAWAASHKVTPVEKVTELLTKLVVQVQEEGKAEAAQYDKFACFCKEQADQKVYAIGKSDDRIASLEAEIEDLTGEIASLDEEVTETKASVATEKSEQGAAQKTRAEEVESYTQEREELEEAIDAVDKAMAEMKRSKKGVKEASLLALTQRHLSKLSKFGLTVPDLTVLASMQQSEDPASYKFGGDDIIATLQELSRTFKAELARTDEEEGTKKHDHNMVEGARSNKLDAYEASIDKKEKLSADKSADKSEKEGLLSEETTARAADQGFLDAVTTTCEDKAKAWDERSKSRAGELTALTEAKGQLQAGGEKYDANEKLVGLVQKPAPSFLQTRGPRRIRELLAFLSKKAHALRSRRLAKLVHTVGLAGDHFAKVRGIIKDLISRLEDDAGAEATQKSFCDTEMRKSVEKRDEENANIETYAADIDKTKSQIIDLNEKITELGNEIAELHKSLNEMTEMRNQEKAHNEQTIADSTSGAESINEAITILNDFYGAAKLIQTGVHSTAPTDRDGNTVGDLVPETFEDGDGRKHDESKGIIGLLEVIASDFERTSSTVTSAEEEAQSSYEAEETRINGEIDAKGEEKDGLESDVRTKESELTEFRDNLKESTTIHEQALDELETLKASCVEGEESYAQRRAERQKEIESLQEALKLLEEM